MSEIGYVSDSDVQKINATNRDQEVDEKSRVRYTAFLSFNNERLDVKLRAAAHQVLVSLQFDRIVDNALPWHLIRCEVRKLVHKLPNVFLAVLEAIVARIQIRKDFVFQSCVSDTEIGDL